MGACRSVAVGLLALLTHARRPIRAVSAGALVLALTVVAAGPAFADAPGQITGTVRGSDGAPLVGIAVSVTPQVSGSGGSATTDNAGSYTVAGLNPGAYTVEFAPPYAEGATYLPRWFNGRDAQGDADPVVVAAGATTAGIDTTLRRASTISGRVTDSQGNALSNIVVSAMNLGEPIGVGGGVVTTGTDGRYTLTGLPPGDFRVQFQQGTTVTSGSPDPGDLVALYYGQRTPSDPWTTVHVGAEATVVGIDAQLHQAGRIAGTVTDANGNPLAGVSVMLERAGNYAYTDAYGHYTITNLEPQDYTVYFEPPDGSDFLHQNFGGVPVPASGFGGPPPTSSGQTPVTVTAGATTSGIDVALEKGGAITGTVTDSQGRPLAGISVDLAPPGSGPLVPDYVGTVTTNASGVYRIGRLAAGTYHVSFSGLNFSGQLYPGVQTSAAAAGVVVAAGATVTGVDARMELGGSISGRVLDPAGHTVNAFVSAYNPDGTVASMAGSNDGGFTITNLAAGSYFVYASALGAPLSGFYVATPGGPATLVAVSAGQTTPGIDVRAIGQPGPATPATAAAGAHVMPLPRTVAVSRAGTVAFWLSCSGSTACAGTASLTVPATRPGARAAGATRTTISHARFLVPVSPTTQVRLRLNASGRALLRHDHGRITAQLSIAGAQGAPSQTLLAHLRSRP